MTGVSQAIMRLISNHWSPEDINSLWRLNKHMLERRTTTAIKGPRKRRNWVNFRRVCFFFNCWQDHGGNITLAKTVMPLCLDVYFLNINCYLSYHIDTSAAGSIHCPTSESRSVMSDSLRPHGLYSPWNSQGQNTAVGSLSLLQGIFPTQESNPALSHFLQVDSLPAGPQGKPVVQ